MTPREDEPRARTLPPSAVITLGGNAILPAGGTGTFEEQLSITRGTMEPIARLVKEGMTVVLSHGNGPIVGNILIRNEAVRDQIPPKPLEIVAIEGIRKLVREGTIVIAAGGGGIPVSRQWDGTLHGVEAVIDKDLASSLLARLLGTEALVMVTSVDRVAVNFGNPDQRDLPAASASELERLLAEGHFPPGSMGPKIQAAIEFIRGGGGSVTITTPEKIRDALEGRAGTRVVKD